LATVAIDIAALSAFFAWRQVAESRPQAELRRLELAERAERVRIAGERQEARDARVEV
jgi:hypothetical protein